MDLIGKQPVPAELLPGARNAVVTCLAIKGGDRVAILTDGETERIGLALREESLKAGAEVEMLFLEQFGQRPFTGMPEKLTEALRNWKPTATFFAARGQKGEIAFRIPMRHVLVDELNVRHGHMIDIDERLMVEGMLANYDVVSQLVHRVTDRVRAAREIKVTSPKGTAMRVRFSPELRWKPCPGIYHTQGEWGNLPEGETFTCPLDAEGVIAADVLGDYFSRKYGVLDTPVIFMLSQGRVVGVRHDNKVLENELRGYLATGENSDRVGEFAIGANLWVKRLSGNLLQDEKIPGVHVAFGDSYPEETGAKWAARTHVDVIPTECTIEVDGRMLMQDGRFEPDVLAGIQGLPE
ncbi:MAG TPA: aminopeptidase [Chloroflexota bacterium]|nr:aminopeptidase [Chloroflexota bacterium]